MPLKQQKSDVLFRQRMVLVSRVMRLKNSFKRSQFRRERQVGIRAMVFILRVEHSPVQMTNGKTHCRVVGLGE